MWGSPCNHPCLFRNADRKGASECLLEAILIHLVKVLEMKVLFNDLEYSG